MIPEEIKIMKKYILVLIMIATVAFACASCSGGDDTTAPAATTTVTTTTEKLTESQPTAGVKIADVAEADSPVERFSDHPALLLWEDPAEIPGDAAVAPTVVPYLSEGNEGVIVLFQGTAADGGYYISEGAPVAEYLCEMGYDVFVCKYRLADEYSDGVLADARRAVKYVRYYAEEFGVKDKKLAVMGFGTGSLLAYIEACDNALGDKVDDIDQQSAAPHALLMYNPIIEPDSGMFAGAAPANRISILMKIGIYYDGTVPNSVDILSFVFDLKNNNVSANVECHGIAPDAPHKDGGDRTDNYAILYEMMKNYLNAYGF